MVWPIIRGESYVAKSGKSMKARGVGGISRGLLVKNRDINNSPSPVCLLRRCDGLVGQLDGVKEAAK
jgi:hypothetical protein